MKNRTRKIALTVCLLSFSSQSFAQCSAPLSWKWWSNTAYELDLTSGPLLPPETYINAFGAIISTYINTDLDPGIGPNGEGQVTLYSGNFGPGFKPGWLEAWSGSLPCTYMSGGGSWDLYTCNGSSTKADNAMVSLNNTFLTSITHRTRQVVMAHEVGHVFGLGHVSTACGSFMNTPISGTEPLSLTPGEVIWINSNY